MSTKKEVNSILSRPHQPSDYDPNSDEANLHEVELAFALTGISQSDLFSPLFPLHSEIASRLIEYFISVDSVDTLVKVASYGRDKINPNLFNYAFSAAVLSRPDTKDVALMSPAEVFPDKFFPAPLFQSAIEELAVVPEGSRVPVTVDVPGTATDKYDEARMEYFRHDLALNVNYYNWHLTHPFNAVRKELVNLDRRGELWYYFHQQIIARYNSERYCNGLQPVEPLSNFDEPIEQGYFPKLCTQHLEHSWASRFDKTKLCDLHRPYEGLSINKTRFQRWIDRVCNAIEMGTVQSGDSQNISLNNDKGIDVVGNLLQSSILSPNRQFYGDICNIGHAFIAYCHDPENLNQQAYGVMGEPSTCMRDALFYRWYAFLVRIAQLHKMQLPNYTKNELEFPGVKITALDTQNIKGGTKNLLNSRWENSDFNLKNGLNFQPDGNVFARVKHLQHDDFQYVLNIQNDNSSAVTGTVRIFLSQKNNTRDRELTFEELRMMWIELDRFQVQLKPGTNNIVRKSTESSVTIPSDNFFKPDVIRQRFSKSDKDQSVYCLAGWPAHLLLPKGTLQGANYLLFAMVSKDDKIVNSSDPSKVSKYYQCTSGSSYCGSLNSKYPDQRSMGFPFDRPAPLEVISFQRFLTSNMKTRDVTIKFSSK